MSYQAPTPTEIKATRKVSLLLQRAYDNGGGGSKKSHTVPNLLQIGTELWPETYKYTDNEEQAFNGYADYIRRLAMASIQAGEDDTRWRACITLPELQCQNMWCARWVDQACPRVVIDAKYAALLMSTDIGEEMLKSVLPPWKAFLIEIPPGLIEIKNDIDGGNQLESILRIQVHYVLLPDGTNAWHIIATTENYLQLWRHKVPTAELCKVNKKSEVLWEHGTKVLRRDNRALALIGRLIGSACIAMSDPSNIREQKPSKGRSKKRKRVSPDVRTFIVGKPVAINCRQAILDYMNNGRGKKGSNPTVQFLVRGHWKHQPYGPKGSLRRLTQIEPYWKGPEEAQILARTIQLKE